MANELLEEEEKGNERVNSVGRAQSRVGFERRLHL